MNRKRTNTWAVIPMVLAIACGALAILWPHWRRELGAGTYIDLDPFLCYKTKKVEQLISVTLSDWFDTGTFEGNVSTAFCAPADLPDDDMDLQDPDTHLMVYKVKGPHAPQTGVRVDNLFGSFLFDTKKTDTLMVPTAKSISPEPPPGQPDPLSEVDHYRCLKVKPTRRAEKFPKGLVVEVDDQFGSRVVLIKKPSKLCLATDKNGEGIKNVYVHLMCYKVKADPRTSATGVQVNNQFSPAVLDLKKEYELCLPSGLY